MPQIPTYGGPQVQQEALRPVYQNTPDVSSGAQAVARGLQQLGQGIETKLDRDAETEANRIDTEITAKWLDWDSEARRKYQGQNVDQYEVEARDWWKKTAGEYGASTNPRVRERIGPTLGRKQNQALGSVLGHVNAERDRFADQQAEAAAQTSIEFGIDTGDMAAARARVRQITADQAARKGWTTEQLDAENQRRLGTLHLAYIDRVAQENAQEARKYYEQNKAEIPGQVQNRVEKVLKGEGDNQFATQFAAQNATLPLAEQIAKAGEIKDPERREKTLLQIKNQHALVKAAQAEREAAASDEAWQLVGQGKRVPERTLQSMNGKERVQLQDYLRDRATRLAAGGAAPKTDMQTYIDLREKLAVGEAVNLRAFTEKISPSDMEKLLDIQTAARKPGERDALLTTQERVKKAAFDLYGENADKKKPAEVYALQTEIDKRIRAQSNALGRKLKPDEEQAAVDSVVMDRVYVSEWGTDPQKPVTTLTPDEQKNAYVLVQGKRIAVSSVPARDRQQIIRALRETGAPATEQAIVELYLRGQQQKPATTNPNDTPR